MSATKPKVIKDFDKLTEEMQIAFQEAYPDGYYDHLVKFADKDGKYVHAVPYETEDRYYLIKMPALIAPKIVKEAPSDTPDDGFPADGDANSDSDKYTDLDSMHIGGHKKDDDDDYD